MNARGAAYDDMEGMYDPALTSATKQVSIMLQLYHEHLCNQSKADCSLSHAQSYHLYSSPVLLEAPAVKF